MEQKVIPNGKTVSRWLHEGAYPVWTVECQHCERMYRVAEWQRFFCECERSTIVADKSITADMPS